MKRYCSMIATALLLPIIFCGCTDGTVFNENKELAGYKWNYKNVLPFDASIPDTTKYYNIWLNLRIHGDYKYSNMFVWIHETAPDKTHGKQRIEVSFEDDYGQLTGKGLGDLYDYRFPYKSKIKFKTTGVYRFEIEQNMRDDDLINVVSAGITVEEWKPEAAVQ